MKNKPKLTPAQEMQDFTKRISNDLDTQGFNKFTYSKRAYLAVIGQTSEFDTDFQKRKDRSVSRLNIFFSGLILLITVNMAYIVYFLDKRQLCGIAQILHVFYGLQFVYLIGILVLTMKLLIGKDHYKSSPLHSAIKTLGRNEKDHLIAQIKKKVISLEKDENQLHADYKRLKCLYYNLLVPLIGGSVLVILMLLASAEKKTVTEIKDFDKMTESLNQMQIRDQKSSANGAKNGRKRKGTKTSSSAKSAN